MLLTYLEVLQIMDQCSNIVVLLGCEEETGRLGGVRHLDDVLASVNALRLKQNGLSISLYSSFLQSFRPLHQKLLLNTEFP